ncbi:MAG TPA: family 43 glycosylhydrolase [Bacteroidales bacterium]|nr:family 43 glycosylhydrolase [Bacteroidales bacterium]
MMTTYKRKLGLAIITLALPLISQAQNPIIRDQFTADPTARVFGDKVYLFPSHDIPTPPNEGLRKDWFCMADYHVFSSANLTDWTDHGMILSQTTVPWADPKAYSMWAPDCIFRNGKYYFYFPTAPDKSQGRGFSIGVAIADKPEGPYIPEPKPIAKVRGFDPYVFIDKDGQAYLYWSMGGIFFFEVLSCRLFIIQKLC